MGDRTIQFDQHEICDICGKKGANDFYGDLICDDCILTDEDGYIIGCKPPVKKDDGAA